MDRQTAIENLLELYENPAHRGALLDADISVKGGNPGCGDIVTVHIKVGEDSLVERIRFEGEGCTISQAGETAMLFAAQNIRAPRINTP